MKHGHCRYYEDGTVDVAIDHGGLPEMTALVPAPFMDAGGREKSISNALDGIYLSGYFLVESKRIKNAAFDQDGAKTSTQLVYRACKTPDEARVVGDKIIEIIAKIVTNRRVDDEIPEETSDTKTEEK